MNNKTKLFLVTLVVVVVFSIALREMRVRSAIAGLRAEDRETRADSAKALARKGGSRESAMRALVDAPRQPPGMLGIGFGLFLLSLPFIQLAFFHFLPGPPPPAKVTAFFFLSASSLCFPAAAFAFYKSVLLLWGRTALEVDSKYLRAITIAGPHGSTRRCKLCRLDSLRVVDPKSEVLGFRSGLVNLVAVPKRGAPIHLLRMYREDVVNQLVKDLPDRIEQLAGLNGSHGEKMILARDIKTEFVSSYPTDTDERKAKPVGSAIAIEERRNDLAIQIPDLGRLALAVPVQQVDSYSVCGPASTVMGK